MRRRSNKVLSASRAHLEEETQSIKAYYEQLIEEARNQSRRWSTRVEEREDRIHWLQLEWKRRMEEAIEFWRPRVNARLVAMGVQMLPRVAYRYGRCGGRGPGRGPRAPAAEYGTRRQRHFSPRTVRHAAGPACRTAFRVPASESSAPSAPRSRAWCRPGRTGSRRRARGRGRVDLAAPGEPPRRPSTPP